MGKFTAEYQEELVESFRVEHKKQIQTFLENNNYTSNNEIEKIKETIKTFRLRDQQQIQDYLKSRNYSSDIIKLNDKVAQIDEDKFTLLHHAAHSGNHEAVEILLDEFCDANKTDRDGCTALHLASENNRLNVVKVLLDRGADKKKYDNKDYTALHYASQAGHNDIVELLYGPTNKINYRTFYSPSPLSLAVINKHTDTVKLLLERGFDASINHDDGVRPLHLAAQIGNVDIVNLLLDDYENRREFYEDVDSGYGINVHDCDRRTALHLASENNHLNVVKVLLDRGADPNNYDDEDYTALHYASQAGHNDIVGLLYDLTENDCIELGNSSLSLAIENEHTDTVRLLLEKGFNASLAHDDGVRPLHLAAQIGNVDIVNLLLDDYENRRDFYEDIAPGYGINVRDGNGKTPLDYAQESGNPDMIALLQSKSALSGNNVAASQQPPLLYTQTPEEPGNQNNLSFN